MPVPKEILPTIIKALAIKKGSLVYDLGCGDGRVLVAAAKVQPQAQYLGIEKSFLPYFLARFNIWRRPQAKINLVPSTGILDPAGRISLTPIHPRSKLRGILGRCGINIFRQDFFKIDLSPATRVFLYLFPEQMVKLLPKLEAELKPGTRVVSCDFVFPNKKPLRVINWAGIPKLISTKHKLYVYQF